MDLTKFDDAIVIIAFVDDTVNALLPRRTALVRNPQSPPPTVSLVPAFPWMSSKPAWTHVNVWGIPYQMSLNNTKRASGKYNTNHNDPMGSIGDLLVWI